MEAKAKRLNKASFFDRMIELGREAAIVMILFTMLGISARVVIRYTFGTPINWVVDLSTILQLYLTFLAAAWLLREEGHISVDIVLTSLKPNHQFFLQIVNSVIGAGVCAIITGYGIVETWSTWKLKLYADMPMEPPKWTLLIVIPLGSLFLFIQFLRRTRHFLEKYRRSRLTERNP